MREAYSEYLLYEPILRILTAKGCKAQCEFPCKDLGRPGRGDKRRLDFKVDVGGKSFAIEVKWAKKRLLNIQRDVEKLEWFKRNYPTRERTCVSLEQRARLSAFFSQRSSLVLGSLSIVT
jgi:hypothetical protein